MKNKARFSIYMLVIGLLLVFSYGCKKDETKNIPVLTTVEVTDITPTSAKSGGNISSDGGLIVNARGVCWGKNQELTIADNKTNDGVAAGIYASEISGLEPLTTYFVRAYATNNDGTGYGSIMSFTTKEFETTVTDADGNVYQTIAIGNQVWMAENLKTTKYNDGTPIPLVTNGTDWSNLTTPGFCWYLNKPDVYKETYGALYNWYTVNTGKLSPTGWHIPTEAEWATLTDYLGGDDFAGGKLKEAGTTHWVSPNTGATNESGFTGLPGGFRRGSDTNFMDINGYTYLWSTTKLDAYEAWSRRLDYDDTHFRKYSYDKRDGFSVRCVKD